MQITAADKNNKNDQICLFNRVIVKNSINCEASEVTILGVCTRIALICKENLTSYNLMYSEDIGPISEIRFMLF